MQDYQSEKEIFRVLLAPTLEAYFVPCHHKSTTDTLNESLAHIAAVCRHIQYIHIYPLSWQPLSDVSLEGFQNLRSVRIDNASSCGSVLRMLNSLVRLESIQVAFCDDSQPDRILRSPLSANLPMPHVLHINGAHMHTLHQLISSLTAPLTAVHPHMISGCSYLEVTQFMNVLCAPRNVNSLHTLSLSLTIYDDTDGDGSTAAEYNRPGSFLDLIAPLLHLHSLRSLAVHASLRPWYAIQYTSTETMAAWHSPLAIDDFSTDTMAHAWPLLCQLEVTHASSFPTDNVALVNTAVVCPSIGALAKLAQACPELKALAMHVADVDEDALESLEEQVRADGGQQTALVDLFLEGDLSVNPDEPRLADIDRLAIILHRIFPRLRGRAPSLPPSSTADLLTRSREYSDMYKLLEKLYVLNVDTSTV